MRAVRLSLGMVLLLVAVYVACSACGDVMLSRGMKMIGQEKVSQGVPWAIAGTASMGIGYAIFLTLLRDVPLSVVVPTTALSYLIIAVLSRLVLHEAVPLQRWAGTILISIGVAMVMLSDLQKRGRDPAPPE